MFSSAASAAGPTLTLEDIKKYAVSHNFAIKAADAEIDETNAQTVQKKAAYYPKIAIAAGPDLRQEETKSTADALSYIEGKWNLFRGSQDKIDVELSETNVRIAESARRRAQFELELDIEGMFYSYLSAASKIKFYEASLELNEKHRQLLRRKQASGMASQSDLMEFELRDSYLRSSISSLLQECEEARLALVRLMGPDVGSNFVPFGDVPHVHLKRSLPEFLAQINATSESVNIASLRAASGSLATKAARGGWFPTVDLETRYGRLPQDIAVSAPAFQGLLLFKWEFFSGFETTAKVAETKARTARLENEFRQRLLTAMTAAEVNYLKMKSLQERVHVEEGNEERLGVITMPCSMSIAED